MNKNPSNQIDEFTILICTTMFYDYFANDNNYS